MIPKFLENLNFYLPSHFALVALTGGIVNLSPIWQSFWVCISFFNVCLSDSLRSVSVNLSVVAVFQLWKI